MHPSENDNGPADVAGPTLCPGSGSWGGWGWQWRPCPVCQSRIDVDEESLTLMDHEVAEKPIDRVVARTVAED